MTVEKTGNQAEAEWEVKEGIKTPEERVEMGEGEAGGVESRMRGQGTPGQWEQKEEASERGEWWGNDARETHGRASKGANLGLVQTQQLTNNGRGSKELMSAKMFVLPDVVFISNQHCI